MITYDIVSNPSHSKARVLEFLPENYMGSDDDSQLALVCESSDQDVLFLEQDGIRINNGEIFEKSFVESILKDNFDFALREMKFRF